MKTKRPIIISTILLIVLAGLCFNIDSALAKEKNIVIAGSHVKGTWYRFSGGVAAMVDKYIPGYKATAQPSPGSIQNIRNLKENHIDLGMIIPPMAFNAYKGEPPFDKDPYPNLRALFNTYSFPMHIIVKENSPVKSLADIKGLRIGTGPTGGGAYLIVELILNEFGLTYKDVRPYYYSVSENTRALADGNIDVTFALTGTMSAAISQLMTMHKVRYVPISMEKLTSLNKKYSYLAPGYVKAGTYKKVKKDVPAVILWGVMCVDANIDEELAYNITKTVFEHKPEIVKILKLAEEMTPETASKNLPVPLHPGAERYYREIKVLK
ncbi:MAG: TAXI family TRAP transporter solute-binding subunit [Deltaproteobacteria bacterium]|nr:TAXI family TRAP transporter solute-binding subunit [Deltaproteobacteria bacterium]